MCVYSPHHTPAHNANTRRAESMSPTHVSPKPCASAHLSHIIKFAKPLRGPHARTRTRTHTQLMRKGPVCVRMNPHNISPPSVAIRFTRAAARVHVCAPHTACARTDLARDCSPSQPFGLRPPKRKQQRHRIVVRVCVCRLALNVSICI